MYPKAFEKMTLASNIVIRQQQYMYEGFPRKTPTFFLIFRNLLNMYYSLPVISRINDIIFIVTYLDQKK